MSPHHCNTTVTANFRGPFIAACGVIQQNLLREELVAPNIAFPRQVVITSVSRRRGKLPSLHMKLVQVDDVLPPTSLIVRVNGQLSGAVRVLHASAEGGVVTFLPHPHMHWLSA